MIYSIIVSIILEDPELPVEGVGAIEKVEVVGKDTLQTDRALGVHVEDEIVSLQFLELFPRRHRRLLAQFQFCFAIVQFLVVLGERALDQLISY